MRQNSISKSAENRVLYFEIMRILAIFFVVFVHTGVNGYFLFAMYPEGSFAFWADLLLSIFSSFAVPLFFAISGALMLNRPEEPLKKLWAVRVLRFGVTLAVISFLYYCQAKDFNPQRINIKEFIIILYSYCSGSITWFLYSYLAYLISLPFLRTLAQNLKNEHFLYLFGIALVFRGVIPIAEYLVFDGNQTLNPYFNLGWVTEIIVIYPLLGYFLEVRWKSCSGKKEIGLIWIGTLIGLALCCVMTLHLGRNMGSYEENVSEQFFDNFSLLSCAAIYLTVRAVTNNLQVSPRVQNGIIQLGQGTFGVYLFHLFVMGLPVSEMVRLAIVNTGMNKMLACLLFCLYATAVSYAITFLLKKIPIIRKYL